MEDGKINRVIQALAKDIGISYAQAYETIQSVIGRIQSTEEGREALLAVAPDGSEPTPEQLIEYLKNVLEKINLDQRG